MPRGRLLVLAVSLGACGGDDTYRPITAVDPTPLASIEAAEAEGAKYPRAGSPWYASGAFGDSAARGTADRKCVDTDSISDARSGEFAAGNFKVVSQRGLKSYWRALHHPFGGGEPLTIRTTRLDSIGESSRAQYSSTGGYPWDRFHQATPRMANHGRWMLVATKGKDWGCFIVLRDVRGA